MISLLICSMEFAVLMFKEATNQILLLDITKCRGESYKSKKTFYTQLRWMNESR